LHSNIKDRKCWLRAGRPKHQDAGALCGSPRLIYALIQWLVIFRYQSLLPFMWGVQLLKNLGRMLVGRSKPVTFAHTPPGAYQNYIYLVLAVLMLVVSLSSARRPAEE
jgi:hypothetical protein